MRRPIRTAAVPALVLALLGLGLPPATAAPEEPSAPSSTAAVTPTDGADQPAATETPTAPAQDLPRSEVKVTKTTDLDDTPLTPGTEFLYLLTVQCSGLRVDCVNETLTDVLPGGLDVTSVPSSTPGRTVSYDEATRTLTVVFIEALQEPVGSVGLGAGSTVNLEIGMRLPASGPSLDGEVITNTARVVADNADEHTSSTDVVVSVPQVVTPVATKRWDDSVVVAGSAAESVITLGVRNGSSTSAEITELSIVDDTAATFESFDLASAALTVLPAGATSARLFVTVDGVEHAAPTLTAPGPFALPDAVTADQVTGVRVVFSADGALLPYDATGGTVALGMVLRDTLRSTGLPQRPTDRAEITNCAVPGAVDRTSGPATGASACAGSQVLPDTLVITSTKTYVPDTNGDFSQGTGEHAVLGKSSPVSARIDATNTSPFPVAELTIREPHAGTPDAPQTMSEFDKLDVSKVRLRLPAGATNAHLTVLYDDDTSAETDHTVSATVPVTKSGARVVGVVVTYTGRDASGAPSIREKSVAGLDVHGALNDKVTTDDLPSGTSPGVANCAAVEGSAGRKDSTGTTAGTACQALQIESPRSGAGGVKTVGQTSVPASQPIPFTLTLKNNGNVTLVNPVISDPAKNPDGTPVMTDNPFTVLRITGVSMTKSASTPDVVLEVFDPVAGSWVAAQGASAEVLSRATGVQARMVGELAPTKDVTLSLVTVRREGVPDGAVVNNCFVPTADGYQGTAPSCSPRITTGPASDSATLNKSISPTSVPRWVPGLTQQKATVTLSVANSGNISMKTLQVTDADADFFDAVDLLSLGKVTFPAGANRVQVDALVAGSWVTGTPATQAALPAGVAAADVTGIRTTFSSTSDVNDGFVLTPCAATGCVGKVILTVSPRQHPRSDAAGAVPTAMSNTAAGSYTTSLNPDPTRPREIPPTDATLRLTEGTAQLTVKKTPSSAISPGETAPFNLLVTNTGTSNISGVVVTDLLPEGLEFDERYVGDGGQPFSVVDVQVPSGTPAVPTPAFSMTTEGERVSSLTWDFSAGGWVLAPGATFTIRIQVRLEAGVTTDQVVTNTMGATGSGPSLTCAGPSVTDGAFGPGAYCTASADVTVKGGAAFSARKWVAGNVDLGWYDNRTKTAVPVGGAQCPVRIGPDGTRFTAYPCIALVNPGDTFDYLLRLVNAGTESATAMRVVDKFPVAGDTGVILKQDRQTAWSSRPTLASEPALSGPGVMTTAYSENATLCTDDLDMGGAGSSKAECSAQHWAAAYSPAVSAAKMDLTFDEPLAPGAGVDITFSMTAPLDVAQSGAPTIAWNSFAHAESTLRNGRPRVLPSTEPIQVGVALVYGSLEITKAIGANPFGLALEGAEFPVQVVCEISPVGGEEQVVVDQQLVVSSSEPARVDHIPSGARCRVWEVDARGGSSDHGADSAVVVDVVGALSQDVPAQQVTVTNDFPVTTLVIVKNVVGAAAPFAGPSFEAEVFCTYGGEPVAGFDPLVVTIAEGATPVEVPSGADCRVVETNSGGATLVTYGEDSAAESAPVTAVADQEVSTVVTNEFGAGSLVVAKEVTGPGAPALAAGPFTFLVVCSFDGRADVFTGTVTVRGDGSGEPLLSEPVTGLPVGAECVVSETGTGGADSTPAPVTVTIPDAVDGEPQTVTAGFTNVFSAATLDLSKIVEGDAKTSAQAAGGVFTVLLTCEREVGGDRVTVHSSSVQIRGGETVRLADAEGADVLLPLGTRCYAEETVTGGAAAVTVSADSYETGVQVGAEETVQALAITVVNTFLTPYGPDPEETPPVVPPVTPVAGDPAPGTPGTPGTPDGDQVAGGAAVTSLPETGANTVDGTVGAVVLLLLGTTLLWGYRRSRRA